ncbi:TetR/AcrR family transcriptional regulator [Candidatus Dependentiae bacterium]|nr:TetR/AcrR family transcriptional regulator [Candidatus Dependentiae bacterium]
MSKIEEKKERLLNVAQSIFSRFGLFKTTIDEIAKAARVGKSSIYYYFKSKEDIFKAVVEKELKTLKEKINQALVNIDNPQEKLKVFILTRMKYLRELANIYNALQNDYLEHYAFVQKLRTDYDNEEIILIKEILQKGIQEERFAIDDVELTSTVILVTLKGVEFEWSTKFNENEIEKNIDKLLDLLFNGILRR